METAEKIKESYPTCLCGKPAKLESSSVIYGRDYGNVWICSDYPNCDSYVGCHKGTDKPLGTLADCDTRHWRNKAHKSFDVTWKPGKDRKFKNRHEAYRWMQKVMRLPKDKAHIAMMGVGQCKILINMADLIRLAK